MSEPSLADDLVRIHKVFTRAVRIAAEAGEGFVRDAPEPEILQGFRLYVEMLFLGLHSHHESEETVAWPYMRARDLPAPYQILVEQHGRIATLIDAGKTALGSGDLRGLVACLSELQGLWLGHFPLEEAVFGPAAWPGPHCYRLRPLQSGAGGPCRLGLPDAGAGDRGAGTRPLAGALGTDETLPVGLTAVFFRRAYEQTGRSVWDTSPVPSE